jgi:hypothetical protein
MPGAHDPYPSGSLFSVRLFDTLKYPSGQLHGRPETVSLALDDPEVPAEANSGSETIGDGAGHGPEPTKRQGKMIFKKLTLSVR